MATKRNPGMALIEAIQFLLDEVVKFDSNPSNVQKAASLRAEIDELESYENDLTQEEQERIAFFEQQDQIHKAQVAAQPFDPETGKGSLIASAIEKMKEQMAGGHATSAATNDPAVQG